MSGQARPSAHSGGRGGSGGGGSKQQQQQPKLSPEELEARRQAEAAAVAEAQEKAAAAAEAERLRRAAEARRAHIDALRTALREREAAIQERIDTLAAFTAAVDGHSASRTRLHPETSLPAIRREFVAQKKALKSDLKKCTAFVKKVRQTRYMYVQA